MSRLTDGTYHQLEEEAGVIPLEIVDEECTKVFFLVDGIYPSYSRFVRGMKEPATRKEKNYTSWQKGARKDVERAFGVLKNTWKFLDRPILLLDLKHLLQSNLLSAPPQHPCHRRSHVRRLCFIQLQREIWSFKGRFCCIE
jgi:hypothetical protein